MIKYNFPSQFFPRLFEKQADELRRVISSRAVDIGYDLSKIYNAITDTELKVGFKFLEEDFGTIQKNLFELCKLSNEQNTATLVSVIYSELALFSDSLKQLEYSRRNCFLLQGVVSNAAALLFEFKESQYNKLLDDLAQLKQCIA